MGDILGEWPTAWSSGKSRRRRERIRMIGSHAEEMKYSNNAVTVWALAFAIFKMEGALSRGATQRLAK